MPFSISPSKAQFNSINQGEFTIPFQEQIDFFKKKLNLPTNVWDDILNEAHDQAFIVAGATKADLLNDLRKAVDDAISKGTTLNQFREQFHAIVKKHGWESYTGSESAVGRDWRTRIIYQTNLSTSYAAGRYAQLTNPDLLKLRPNWEYVHADGIAHPRPQHVAWNGTVLPADDPWWDTHFPPNGWLCHCRITARGRDAYKGQAAPDDGTYEVTDKRGHTHTMPVGVDYGFGYTPGKSVINNLQPFVADKVATLYKPLGEACKADIARLQNKPRSIRNYLQVPKSGPAKKGMKTALPAIDQVHDVPLMQRIPVENTDTPKNAGEFNYNTRTGEPVDIQISTASPHPSLTACHEIGHYLDCCAFGKNGNLASENAPLFDDWRKAVEKSIATSALQSSLRNTQRKDRKKRLNYYLSPKEQWARTYAQWIATRSGDPELQKNVRAIIDDQDKIISATQWEERDFQPIAAAIDAIFKHFGWLK